MSMIRKLRRAPDRSLNFLKRNSVSGYFQSQKNARIVLSSAICDRFIYNRLNDRPTF